MEGSGDEENVMCQVGTVQGEDYTFRFGGKIVDGKLHFRLNMEYEGEDDEVTNCILTCCLLCGRNALTVIYTPHHCLSRLPSSLMSAAIPLPVSFIAGV